MSGGGSKEEQPEQELLSIETYSGKEIGQIKSDATDDKIQEFIQETTKNISHVRFIRTKGAILFGFIDNRHALLEWEKADDFGWSLEIDTRKWKGCTFEGTTLIKLNCSNNNQLTEIPALSNCVSLEKLYCSDNELTELPDLHPCVSLEKLYCYHNQLTELPELSNCVLLKTLYCSHNQLTELPDLRPCVSLKWLDYSANQLTELPVGLSQCVSLKYLYCHRNQLTELPDLRPCVSLNILSCGNNQLTEEPKVPSGTVVYN
jgi:hypothetical protein